jgi:uncharacterized membrane protein YfcA
VAWVWILSTLVGVALGMLGGGGSILTLPILRYAAHVGEKEAIATSLVVVGVTSAAALVSHAREGNVVWRIGGLFAATGSVGAFVGGWLADWVPASWLIGGFLLMMIATGVAMIRGRRSDDGDGHVAPWPKIAGEGFVVGVVTGLVGAGGGFLVVPALALLGGLPMKKAVGTSLFVIAIKSLFGYLGHATHVSIDVGLAAQVSVAAVVGSVAGGFLASKVPAASLKRGFGGFVLVMAAYLAYKELLG